MCVWWLQTYRTSHHWSLLSCWQNGRRCWFFLFSLRQSFIHSLFSGPHVLSLGYGTWWFILKEQRGESHGQKHVNQLQSLLLVSSLSGEDAGHKKLGCHFHRNPLRWIHQGSLGSIFGCAGGSAEKLECFDFHSWHKSDPLGSKNRHVTM